MFGVPARCLLHLPVNRATLAAQCLRHAWVAGSIPKIESPAAVEQLAVRIDHDRRGLLVGGKGFGQGVVNERLGGESA